MNFDSFEYVTWLLIDMSPCYKFTYFQVANMFFITDSKRCQGMCSRMCFRIYQFYHKRSIRYVYFNFVLKSFALKKSFYI